MSDQVSKATTSVFGLNLWVVVGICVGVAIVLLLFFISLWLTSRKSRTARPTPGNLTSIPVVSKEIQEIQIPHSQVQPDPCPDPEPLPEEESLIGYNRIHIEIGKDHRISYPERYYGSSSHGSGGEGGPRSGDQAAAVVPEVSHLGWGHWYTLRELKASTNEFADENVIGEGGYGIVYYGLLEDKTEVAVKNLLNNRGQAEKEFKVEVEAIGRVRHKNLVRLLGYCAEGAHRMLVYEYVNNGNLEQWLHGDVGPCSPLTWEIRMKIILGTAKGLTYLHEGLEPKVVHRDIKSSNILLDKQWNPKVSDFGLAKLLCSDSSYITTRVMGTFGYVAPEYASTGMLNERSDIYSFGILIMEIISGRNPVDYSRVPEEVNLVDWLKKMVTDKNLEGVLDPKLPEKPISRALKRVLLVALKCVDPTAQKRPKMGHIVHMLEAEESPFKDDRRAGRDAGRVNGDTSQVGLIETKATETGGSGQENVTSTNEEPRHQESEEQNL
ncbi:hypothetical protein NL676_022924 [Syzygium grande]|nr:hypothetical protein NL676_022924 [Syzygium grande]